MTADENDLFSKSVIVTGTHYSMTTLLGRILGASKSFNVVHEPLNHQPPLGYAAVPTNHWYEYFGPDRIEDLGRDLRQIQFGHNLLPQTLRRMSQIRSWHDVLRAGKFARTGALHARHRRRAVFKDPFLCFTSRHLQSHFGLSVVLTVRHPCGFAESLARRGAGFDFNDLLQPQLLADLPEFADEIRHYARSPQPVLHQAALLWRVVYGFADQYLLNDPRTTFVRQEDLAAKPAEEASRIFSFLNARKSEAVDRFMSAALNAKSGDSARRTPIGSYVHRDARSAAMKWRQRLSPEDIEKVMKTAGPAAQRFGYHGNGETGEAIQ
ncbi:sulfotransferase domain-containing protein [Leisingera sp. McT4-56]|uniref:sulfotransferase domain-containing protein n=1 Tax=Leisingera sp. McT4-56 TaxID=2881255 RepID=UPI001CF83F39|nr:sulfotransferase domain-containing protein [Leisingera sp. McT4-56]MCB4457234.1 sulfotransferase domain-containing protein [Leisingera sp. McT4-56]